MNLFERIQNYIPVNQQEEHDKEQILQFMRSNEDCFERENLTGHMTVSVWTVNKERTKSLMAHHNLYNYWAWIGGHADGNKNLSEVALKELNEETGVKNARLVSEEIFSLEILGVDGHVKRGKWVPSHLHFNVTYLAEADEEETLIVKEDENSAVKWWALEEIATASTEKWMIENIYSKLIEKMKQY